jgi:hypothetical protein
MTCLNKGRWARFWGHDWRSLLGMGKARTYRLNSRERRLLEQAQGLGKYLPVPDQEKSYQYNVDPG